ncbi:MAG TPA: hypothetical protein VNV43_07260, partial [Candidatus Acidoferrales bacterium]|nr:hypothetical protein [Candidatus Acidoferrales bacterium]
MKTKFKTSICAAAYLPGSVVCAGSMMLMASCTHAQNLFVSEPYNNAIAEITPGGVQSTFASRLNNPWGLAFNRTDD